MSIVLRASNAPIDGGPTPTGQVARHAPLRIIEAMGALVDTWRAAKSALRQYDKDRSNGLDHDVALRNAFDLSQSK